MDFKFKSSEEENRKREKIWKGIVNNALEDGDYSLLYVQEKPRSRFSVLITRIGIAASLLIFFGLFLWYNNKPETENVHNTELAVNNDIAPGDDKAVLTLEDGSQIVLGNENEEVIFKNDVNAFDLEKGRLVYQANPDINQAIKITYNTVTTPRGGRYQIVLPDGTNVWLNAASSIRFPTMFSSDFRTVELTGEAYFEVAKNAKLPFQVKHVNQLVEVLGTHFNVNTYQEEGTLKTTLLEGSVRVSILNEFGIANSVILKPGEESTITVANERISVGKADTESTIAWKNGDFVFVDEELSSIMKKLEKWYDVEVIYNTRHKHHRFNGMVSRKKNISEVLKIMEFTGKIKFKVEGRRITIMD